MNTIIVLSVFVVFALCVTIGFEIQDRKAAKHDSKK
jgi:hypothetical protein